MAKNSSICHNDAVTAVNFFEDKVIELRGRYEGFGIVAREQRIIDGADSAVFLKFGFRMRELFEL
jgi:hypothetical protein